MKLKVHWRLNLVSSWTWSVLTSFCHVIWLCHSFKGCFLIPSFPFHNYLLQMSTWQTGPDSRSWQPALCWGFSAETSLSDGRAWSSRWARRSLGLNLTLKWRVVFFKYKSSFIALLNIKMLVKNSMHDWWEEPWGWPGRREWGWWRLGGWLRDWMIEGLLGEGKPFGCQERCVCLVVVRGRDPWGSEDPLREAPEIPLTLGPREPPGALGLALHPWRPICPLGPSPPSQLIPLPSRAASALHGSLCAGGSCGREREGEGQKPGQWRKLLWGLRGREPCGVPLPTQPQGVL